MPPKGVNARSSILQRQKISATEIDRRIQNVYGTECMSYRSVFRWCEDFRSRKINTGNRSQPDQVHMVYLTARNNFWRNTWCERWYLTCFHAITHAPGRNWRCRIHFQHGYISFVSSVGAYATIILFKWRNYYSNVIFIWAIYIK